MNTTLKDLILRTREAILANPELRDFLLQYSAALVASAMTTGGGSLELTLTKPDGGKLELYMCCATGEENIKELRRIHETRGGGLKDAREYAETKIDEGEVMLATLRVDPKKVN